MAAKSADGMSVAVCISGQARNVPACHDSLLENLLGGQRCDFFVHSWSQSELHIRDSYAAFVAGETRWNRFWKYRQLKRRFEDYLERMAVRTRSFPKQPDEIRSVVETAYHPVALQVEPQEDFDVSRFDHRQQNATIKLEETHLKNLLSMFTSMQRACELKSAHERETGVQYDCVVRCRSDLFFFAPFSLADYADLLEKAVVVPRGGDFRGGLNDQLALSSSQNMNAYCSAAGFVDAYYESGGLMHAESLLRAHLADRGLTVERAPIDYEIVREHFADAAEFLAARATADPTGEVGAPSFRNPGTASIAAS
jgi:hypothetical protein